jgi:hypothetical protein
MLMREFGWTPSEIDEMAEEDFVRITRILEIMNRERMRNAHR